MIDLGPRDDDDLALRLALAKLHAQARAEDAVGGIATCRGHLGAADLLLAYPGVPGVDGAGGRVAAVGGGRRSDRRRPRRCRCDGVRAATLLSN
jgi:hypothetical protein